MAVTRRHLLAASAGIAAAVAACAGGIGMQWWDQPPGASLKHLSEDEAEFVRAISGAAFPSGEVIDLSGADADLDRFFDAMLSGMPALTARLLKLLIQALEDLSVLLASGRFTTLPLATQQSLVEGWLSSDQAELRSAVQSLVVLISMGYTTHPEIAPMMSRWHRCGYGR